jgi:hypothetical protein
MMARSRTLALLCVVPLVIACGDPISDKYTIENQPYELEEVAGSDLLKVVLEPAAVARLGIEVASVEDAAEGLVVPSGALWMDVEGRFWVYMNNEPNAYLRHEVDLLDDDGTRALLAAGPSVGTDVVIFGVPELFGTEVGVGK